MKTFSVLVIIVLTYLHSLVGLTQTSVQFLEIKILDLVYDSASDRLYASIPSLNVSGENSIGIINPQNGVLEKTVYMGPDPYLLAASDDGQYIYTSFLSSPTYRRFDVADQTAGPEFAIGFDTYHGALFAWDIEVMPGHPETVAISRVSAGNYPTHLDLAIFDNGIMRTINMDPYLDNNQLEFVDANHLVTFSNQNTGYNLRKLLIGDTAFTEIWNISNIFSGFNIDFIYHKGRVYSTNGSVGDINRIPYVAGAFNGGFGPVFFDKNNDLVCFATINSIDELVIRRFSPHNFLFHSEIYVSNDMDYPYSLTGCGKSCYALSTSGGRLAIVKINEIGIDHRKSELQIAIYPNPVEGIVMIEGAAEIRSIRITDVNGKTVFHHDSIKENKIDCANFEKGVYFAIITLPDYKVAIRKIVKM
ncbi:MAG: hypothetical protein CVT92_03190 [Bacteroidetes bacterium HGW-Bacteroidetes-1]|jgi:hypothetical protein|nr:MAG: hypothetical protein CVT92_03190 [Bacteroidetes bacterium HGW-Bacteroidetes-1]